jgi:hypothetical protein
MCLGNKSPVLQQKTRSKRRKTVRFQSTKNLCSYHEGLTELTEQMILDMWCRKEDFVDFRQAADATCDQAILKGHASFIKRTYGYSDLKTQACLDLWSKLKESRRGLERFISKDYAKERHYIRNKQIKGVLYTQHQLTEDGVTGPARRAGIIRKVATTVSEEAVIFAMMLGSADQAAVVSFMKESSPFQSMVDMVKQNQTPPVEDTKVARSGLQLYLERQSKGLENTNLKHSFISSKPSKKNYHARLADLETQNTFLFQIEGNSMTVQLPARK